MGERHLNRAVMAIDLQLRLGIPRAHAELLVDSIISYVCASLEGGEHVKIAGFGTFYIVETNEREGRNPKTGEPHNIPARKDVRFRGSPCLARAVAHGAP